MGGVRRARFEIASLGCFEDGGLGGQILFGDVGQASHQ
jgi:hypothetical protein